MSGRVRFAAPIVVLAALVFALASPREESFRFVIIGDRTGEVQPGIYEKVWQQADAAHPSFVVTVGDAIQGLHDSTAEAQWRELDKILAPYRRYKLFLTPGNHDIWSSASEQLFQKHSGHAPHYSFDYAQAHFTVLDNSRADDLSAGEMAFLEQDLKAHAEQPVKFIMMHRPSWIFNALLRNPDFPLHQTAKKYGVQYIVAGHVHEMLHYNLDGIDYVSMVSSGGHLRASGKYEDGWFFGFATVDIRKNEPIWSIQSIDGRTTTLRDWGPAGLSRSAP